MTTISPGLGIALMLNNYFHDLSVAMFLVALLGLAAVAREASREPSAGAAAPTPQVPAPQASAALARLERLFRRTAGASFVFLILFGAVRAATYRQFEWANAAAHGQIPALVVKHVLFVILIVAGVVYWRPRKSPAGEAAEKEGAAGA